MKVGNAAEKNHCMIVGRRFARALLYIMSVDERDIESEELPFDRLQSPSAKKREFRAPRWSDAILSRECGRPAQELAFYESVSFLFVQQP